MELRVKRLANGGWENAIDNTRGNAEELRLITGHWAAVDTVAAGLTGETRRQTESYDQVRVYSRETSHFAEGREKTMALQSSNSNGPIFSMKHPHPSK
jgi:hypothetical protein